MLILRMSVDNKVFGGSNVSCDVNESAVYLTGSNFSVVYDGNNQGGRKTTANLDIISSTIIDVFGGGRNNAPSGICSLVINSEIITNAYSGGKDAGLTTCDVYIYDGTITNVFRVSNTSGNITTSNITFGNNQNSNIQIGTLYGWNNLGSGTTTTTNITTYKGNIFIFIKSLIVYKDYI